MGEWTYTSTFFLTSELVRDEWSASRLGRFRPGKSAPGTHLIGGCVDPRTGLDKVEERQILTLLVFELQPLGRRARSQSPYRLIIGRLVYLNNKPERTWNETAIDHFHLQCRHIPGRSEVKNGNPWQYSRFPDQEWNVGPRNTREYYPHVGTFGIVLLV
jgi:hypothetical protein